MRSGVSKKGSQARQGILDELLLYVRQFLRQARIIDLEIITSRAALGLVASDGYTLAPVIRHGNAAIVQ